jgi:hypothetical protein
MRGKGDGKKEGDAEGRGAARENHGGLRMRRGSL